MSHVRARPYALAQPTPSRAAPAAPYPAGGPPPAPPAGGPGREGRPLRRHLDRHRARPRQLGHARRLEPRGRPPHAGDDVVLRTDAQALGSAPVVLDGVTPLLNSVAFDGSWIGTLTLRANAANQTAGQLNAHVITLAARAHSGDEVILGIGTEVHSDVALNLAGGSIAGAGVVQAEGAITVNGVSMIDPPTLGAQLDVGNALASTTMTCAPQAVPLVVTGAGNIDVNPNAAVTFDTLPNSGQAAVAVVAGDQAPHTLTINGGLVQQDGSAELVVGLGVVMESGMLEAGPATEGTGVASWSYHFTGVNEYRAGLTAFGGQVIADGSLSFDGGVNIAGGQVDVAGGATLEAGAGLAPVAISLSGAGDLRLEGMFLAHGDFAMTGGLLATMESAHSQAVLDPGDTFWLAGGTVAATSASAGAGGLAVDGSLVVSGGLILGQVELSQPLPSPDSGLAFTSSTSASSWATATGASAADQPALGSVLSMGSAGDFTSSGSPLAGPRLMSGNDAVAC
jgi:hypothetical protein